HEINGNYYAIKKIRSKIKTYALRSESRTAITDRKLAGRTLRECLVWEREDELSTLRAFFQIIGQPICRDSSPVLHVSNTRRFWSYSIERSCRTSFWTSVKYESNVADGPESS